jgi:hypothetical protein
LEKSLTLFEEYGFRLAVSGLDAGNRTRELSVCRIVRVRNHLYRGNDVNRQVDGLSTSLPRLPRRLGVRLLETRPNRADYERFRGAGAAGDPGQPSAEDFQAVVDTCFYGVVYTTRAAIPVMRKQKSGHIFQVCQSE